MIEFLIVFGVLFSVGAWYYLTQNAGELSLEGGYMTPVDMSGAPGPVAVPNLEGKIWEFAYAIAFAEGFGVPGKVPTLYHNPGDLGPGDTGFQGEEHSGSVVSKLPDDATGWQLLYNKIARAFAGQSSVYSANMTIMEWAQKYAADSQVWANNVASYLGLTPDTRIVDWLQM